MTRLDALLCEMYVSICPRIILSVYLSDYMLSSLYQQFYIEISIPYNLNLRILYFPSTIVFGVAKQGTLQGQDKIVI